MCNILNGNLYEKKGQKTLYLQSHRSLRQINLTREVLNRK